MNLTRAGVAAVLFLSAVGCASVPPPPVELVDARVSYARAQTGPAKELPAELENARRAVEKAEQAYRDDPRSVNVRELAYLASRKVLVVEARGRIAENEKARQAADAVLKNDAATKMDGKDVFLENKNQTMAQTSRALADEQLRRATRSATPEDADADQRAKESWDRVSAFAAVKEDRRGTVITLSGGALFATNKSDLLPGASERLDQVAEALKAQPDSTITVFGYTDSQGDATSIQSLSEKRAASVRQHLVARGVAADHIKAVGKGKADPVADNASAEGRANNRRVEIVIGADGGG